MAGLANPIGEGRAQSTSDGGVPAPMQIRASRPAILHVSGDFPDPIDDFKTPVIRMLLDMTSGDFEHSVISLNRRTPAPVPFFRELVAGFGRPELRVVGQGFEYGTAIRYDAPPKGVLHATMLRQLGDRLAASIDRTNSPDLLVGHKLAIEGIVVRRAAAQLNVPYAISIQGDTDTKIMALRPDLAEEFRAIFHEAAVVFPFTPWALRQVEERLGKRRGPVTLLPCPTELDEPLTPQAGGDGLLSVFHLKNYRRKNLQGMARALDALDPAFAPRLSIVGGGSDEDIRQSRAAIGGRDRIRFEGPLDRVALRQRMNRAAAFVLPSLRESFGLVFIEALFAGLPIIYPANNAVDGYFDNAPFAVKVNPKDSQSISRAMHHVLTNEAQMKAELQAWQQSPAAEYFSRPHIGRAFAQGLAIAASGR